MSDFNRFSEQVTRTDGERPSTAELQEAYCQSRPSIDLAPYVRVSSGKTREQIEKLRRRIKRKIAWRAFRRRIARFIFRF